MNENKTNKTNYLTFLLFAFGNYFSSNKWLKNKQKEIIYYKSFYKDFYCIKLSSRLISIIIIIILYFFAKMDVFSIFKKTQTINSFLHLLPFYGFALCVYIFITLIIYSFKYNKVKYYEIENNEDVAKEYSYALSVWDKHSFIGSSPFINNCIIYTSPYTKYKYEYALDKLYFIINRIFRVIMIFVFLWTDHFFAGTYFAEGDYLTSQLVIILIIQVFTLLLSYLQIIKYKKVEFTRTY